MSTHTVRLKPSGHEFIAGAAQSLLHAGLVAGVNLSYGCENGSCGDCKARLLKGQTETLQHSDYVLTRAEKASQTLLMCCHRAISDVELQVQEKDQPLEIAQQTIKLKVRSIQPLSDDVLQVQFKTPRNQALQFLAGQYVQLTLDNGLSRNKSLANCPCDGNNPTVHIQRHANDPFSAFVFDKLKKNTPVELRGPKGNFVLKEDDKSRPILLIAYQTGFSSINSLIEHLVAQGFEHQIRLYWISSGERGMYRENYCHSLEDALDNFQYRPVCIPQAENHLLLQTLKQILTAHTQQKGCDVFAALPSLVHDEARHILQNHGFEAQHIHLDYLEKL